MWPVFRMSWLEGLFPMNEQRLVVESRPFGLSSMLQIFV
jgi:hypothetical protein